MERLIRMRRNRPEVVIAASESQLREDLGLLGHEPVSWLRHAQNDLVPLIAS